MKYKIGTILKNRNGKTLEVIGFEDRFVVMRHQQNGKQYMRFPKDVDKYYKIVAQPVEEEWRVIVKNNRHGHTIGQHTECGSFEEVTKELHRQFDYNHLQTDTTARIIEMYV